MFNNWALSRQDYRGGDTKSILDIPGAQKKCILQANKQAYAEFIVTPAMKLYS